MFYKKEHPGRSIWFLLKDSWNAIDVITYLLSLQEKKNLRQVWYGKKGRKWDKGKMWEDMARLGNEEGPENLEYEAVGIQCKMFISLYFMYIFPSLFICGTWVPSILGILLSFVSLIVISTYE